MESGRWTVDNLGPSIFLNLKDVRNSGKKLLNIICKKFFSIFLCVYNFLDEIGLGGTLF